MTSGFTILTDVHPRDEHAHLKKDSTEPDTPVIGAVELRKLCICLVINGNSTSKRVDCCEGCKLPASVSLPPKLPTLLILLTSAWSVIITR